jgi:hypothetical protein
MALSRRPVSAVAPRFTSPPATYEQRRLTSLAFNLTGVDVSEDMGPFEIAPATSYRAVALLGFDVWLNRPEQRGRASPRPSASSLETRLPRLASAASTCMDVMSPRTASDDPAITLRRSARAAGGKSSAPGSGDRGCAGSESDLRDSSRRGLEPRRHRARSLGRRGCQGAPPSAPASEVPASKGGDPASSTTGTSGGTPGAPPSAVDAAGRAG